MNPYLAKLHSLNFAKPGPRATDKTGKTDWRSRLCRFCRFPRVWCFEK